MHGTTSARWVHCVGACCACFSKAPATEEMPNGTNVYQSGRLQTLILPCHSHRGPAGCSPRLRHCSMQLGLPSRGTAAPPLVDVAAALSAILLLYVAAGAYHQVALLEAFLLAPSTAAALIFVHVLPGQCLGALLYMLNTFLPRCPCAPVDMASCFWGPASLS